MGGNAAFFFQQNPTRPFVGVLTVVRSAAENFGCSRSAVAAGIFKNTQSKEELEK